MATGLVQAGHRVHYIAIDSAMSGTFGRNGYVVYPGKRATSRGAEWTFPSIINDVSPHVIISHWDIQENHTILGQHHRNTVWIAQTPLDVEEIDDHVKRLVSIPDFRVFLTNRAYEMFGDKRTSFHIPLSVDTSVFKPGPKDIDTMTDLNLTTDDFVLLFVGRPNWRKNIPVMLATIHELVHHRGRKNVKMVMHTSFDDPALPVSYDQMALGMDVNDNLVFSGGHKWDKGVPPETLANLYRTSDVYFSPHAGEGFGVPMVEAMACGVPVVATKYTSTHDFVAPGRGMFIPIGRTATMMGVRRPVPKASDCADAIEKMMDLPPDKFARMKAACAVHGARYSDNVVKAAWARLVERLGYERVDANAI